MPHFNDEYFNRVSKKGIHRFYDKTVEHAIDMGVHVEGETPEKILNINRPNEQADIKAYRLESYQPVTQSLSEKVINTVNKIFNPRLWDFDFPEMTTEDSLGKYLTEDYPFYRSIMNFVTETFTTKDFSDPNGAIVVMPQNFNIDETQLFEPVATIYTSESLVDYVDSVYYTFSFGDVIKVFTTEEIRFYKKEKRGGKETWVVFFEHSHNFGFVPVFRLGGIIKGKTEPFYFESWIRGVLPHWNQVVQLTSDAQAAYMGHIFMDEWEYATDCDADGCDGGFVRTEIMSGKESSWEKVECRTCNGRGKVSRGPYGITTINRDAINPDAPLPTPPRGYITKPIEIIEKVEERITKEEKRGLASINMEIVQMVGNDQSGVAKTVDREDLNAFLSRYSRHVFEFVLPKLIFYIATWRYGMTSNVMDILPKISQPKDFNILNLQQLSTEYKDASNANVSANYTQHIETELIQSKFANNEEERKRNSAIIKLQPYPGAAKDDLLSFRNLGQPDWKIHKSINIIEIVDMAIEDNTNFLDKKLKDQREITDDIAKEQIGFKDDAPTIPVQEVEPVIPPVIEEPEIEEEEIE